MSSEVQEKIINYLLEESEKEIKPGEISSKSLLREDLGLDSMESVTMVMELEDHYNISIDNDELFELNTIGDLVKIVEEKVKVEPQES